MLLSAIAGRAARRVFEHAGLDVVTTEANIGEVREYLPSFAARYALPEELLIETLEILPITIYDERRYAEQLPAAHALLGARDADDVALAALALTLNVPVWSNDRDYEGFPTGVFTTARLLQALDA